MNDDQLSRLLKDAVSDIEPADRIEELRASVRPRGRIVHLLHARPWYAAAGIVAAVICLVATITTVASNNSADPGFAGPPGSTRPTVIATDTAVPTESPTGETRTYAVYYIGTSPQDKPVLYREFHRGSAAASPTRLAIDGLESRPLDPDYVTPWRPRDIVEVKPDLARDVVYVSLGHDRLEDRPASMSPAYARAAVQQVVYTVQAAVGKRLPVQFLIAGVPAATVLGIPATEPTPTRARPCRASCESGVSTTASKATSSSTSSEGARAISRRPRSAAGARAGSSRGRSRSTSPGWSPGPTRWSPRTTTRPVARKGSVRRPTPARSWSSSGVR
jgi:hypothetical protein